MEPILGTADINYILLKDRTPDTSANIKVKEFHRSFIDMYSNSNEASQKRSLLSEMVNFFYTIEMIPKVQFNSVLTITKDPYVYRKLNVPGDNPQKNDYIYYGTPNVDASSLQLKHGTMCVSIVAGNRNNGIGTDGIAESVKIMAVRATLLGGDEYDKDVANAIRYAVDNGAKIINMSFGKKFSPNKQWVDDAIRYAAQKGVLLIGGSGNNGTNNDEDTFYPSAVFDDGSEADNFLKVGASSSDNTLVGSFSNYGKKTVDVFAPGHQIYVATDTAKYDYGSGTSFASPMVTGVAALLWSYYPKLTYKQVKHCIEQSVTPIETLVIKPGTKEKVPFSSLSKTGGIVNAYKAFKQAEEINKQKQGSR